MPASKAQRALVAKRRTQAIELKLAGLTFQQIADQLGYDSRQSACTDVNRALEQAVMERNFQADVMIEEELLRLGRLQAAVWREAVKGDIKSIDTVLKIIVQRCKLLRIDAPTQVEITVQQLQDWRKDLTAVEGVEYAWSGDVEPGVQALPAGQD